MARRSWRWGAAALVALVAWAPCSSAWAYDAAPEDAVMTSGVDDVTSRIVLPPWLENEINNLVDGSRIILENGTSHTVSYQLGGWPNTSYPSTPLAPGARIDVKSRHGYMGPDANCGVVNSCMTAYNPIDVAITLSYGYWITASNQLLSPSYIAVSRHTDEFDRTIWVWKDLTVQALSVHVEFMGGMGGYKTWFARITSFEV